MLTVAVFRGVGEFVFRILVGRHFRVAWSALLLVLLLAGCSGSESTVVASPALALVPTAVPTLPVDDAVVTQTKPPVATTTTGPAPHKTTPPELSPTPTPDWSALPPAPEAEAVLVEVAPVVLEIRGLPAIEIAPGLLDREQLAEYLLGLIAADYPPEEQQLDALEWTLLGLLAPGEDILNLQLELLGADILGFYDQDAKTMYVIDGGDGGMAMLKFVLTHEYVHALQDAAFDLGAIDDRIGTDNGDVLAAFTALVEGDATAAGVVAFYRVVTTEELGEFLAADSATSLPPSRARDFLNDLLGFSYTAGWGFVEALLTAGGWDLVDAAYTDLPASTEQIIYPDKYLARELPEDVELPDLSESALDGWHKLRRNVMGAFFLELLFGEFGPVGLASGWRGDEYAIYQDGMDNLLVLKTRWDAVVADEFWDAATLFVQGDWLDSFSAGAARTVVASDLVTWDREFHSARLFRDGNDVYLVVGNDSAVVERVWEQLRG
ncbi:MAG TPA: hypothetical protein QGH28_07420 [Chloroflexota bacterium]|nr:hypothetical protein [Chloroflexota bacterium]